MTEAVGVPGQPSSLRQSRIAGLPDPPAVKSCDAPLGGASRSALSRGRTARWVLVCLGMGDSAPSATASRGLAQPKQGQGAGWTASRSYAEPRRKGVIRDLVDRETLSLVYASDWRPMRNQGGES